MRSVLKWTLRAGVLLLILIVAAVLLLDTAARKLIEWRLRSLTGLETQIEHLEIGLRNSRINLQGLKIYNTPEFGGQMFFHLPELYLEYDHEAIGEKQLRLQVARLDFGELNVVVNHAGQTNLMVLKSALEKKQHEQRAPPAEAIVAQPDWKFAGIDELTLTLGKINFVDLRDRENNRTLDLGIRGEKFSQIKSLQDLGFQVLSAILRKDSSILGAWMGGFRQLPKNPSTPSTDTNAPPP